MYYTAAHTHTHFAIVDGTTKGSTVARSRLPKAELPWPGRETATPGQPPGHE